MKQYCKGTLQKASITMLLIPAALAVIIPAFICFPLSNSLIITVPHSVTRFLTSLYFYILPIYNFNQIHFLLSTKEICSEEEY